MLQGMTPGKNRHTWGIYFPFTSKSTLIKYLFSLHTYVNMLIDLFTVNFWQINYNNIFWRDACSTNIVMECLKDSAHMEIWNLNVTWKLNHCVGNMQYKCIHYWKWLRLCRREGSSHGWHVWSSRSKMAHSKMQIPKFFC